MNKLSIETKLFIILLKTPLIAHRTPSQVTLLAIIAKYGILISEWGWLVLCIAGAVNEQNSRKKNEQKSNVKKCLFR